MNSCSGLASSERGADKSDKDLTARERLLLRYQLLRAKNWKRYKKGKKLNTYKKIRPKKARSRRKVKRTARKSTAPVLNRSELEELKIEIDQNMSFFCMKKRRDRRFRRPGTCQQFARKKLSSCKGKSQGNYSRKILRCLKNNLY